MNIGFLLLPIIMLNSLAKIFMKAAAIHSDVHTLSGVFNLWFIAAIFCLGLSFLCWQAALRRKPVSFLHPFCALIYAVVPALSVFLFQESVSAKYVAGVCCIIAGVCITSVSARQTKDRRPEGPLC